MKPLTIVVSDAMYLELEMQAGDRTPAAVGLVAVQMLQHAIETDDLPAVPAV